MTLKIKYDPEIYLIARPTFIVEEMRRFLHKNDMSGEKLRDASGTDAEKITEMATRLCYQSYKTGRKSSDFHTNIIESGHGSTLEHVNWTFIIAGVSRSFSHELVRHRAGFAYSQLSQRYVDASDIAFVMPPAIQQLSVIDRDVWQWSMVQSLDAYKAQVKQLIDAYTKAELENGVFGDNVKSFSKLPRDVKTSIRKRAREAARSVLPNAAETHIAVTANARAWRHFIEMRSADYADAEIRKVAVAIYDVLVVESPQLFGDFEKEEQDLGWFDEELPPALVTKNHKI